MTEITITFGSPLNHSVQEGDTAYYIKTLDDTVGGFTTHSNDSNIVTIGIIKDIETEDSNSDGVDDLFKIKCDIDESTVIPSSGDFILFSKNRQVNEASILGYYGEFEFKNNSKQKAELFTTGCDVSENSK